MSANNNNNNDERTNKFERNDKVLENRERSATPETRARFKSIKTKIPPVKLLETAVNLLRNQGFNDDAICMLVRNVPSKKKKYQHNHQNSQQKMCNFGKNCNKQGCTFNHECVYNQNGACRNGEGCKFRHTQK